MWENMVIKGKQAIMKKHLLCILIVIVMAICIGTISARAAEVEDTDSQTGEYGSFVDGKKVLEDMLNKNGAKVHPRIIMSEEKFASLRSHIGDGSVTAALLEELRGEADRHVSEDPVVTYELTDDHLLETSKRVQRRVAALALAYNIFGDEKYAVRCYEELEAAAKFSDWSPKHFLDTAEMCTAFAYGYDWLYNWMTPDKRKVLRDSMIEKGLNQVMEDYKDLPRERTYKWYQDLEGDNWQLVCTGGTNLVALAIGDEKDAKSIAEQALTFGYKRAYSFVRRAYSNPDGTYIEGLGYWDYATYYLGLQSSALISATGTDYGLADYEGIKKSVDFVRYMSSNTSKSFSFGDDGESRDTGWAVFLWLGEHLNSPEISAIRLRNIEADKEFRYLDVLWIDESKQTGAGNNNATDWGAVGASNASFRNNWDTSGLVAALHTGENNYKYHGHYDLGSFYIEANGARFFTDLGNENYKLQDRQFSYRIKAEGHNTLVINPTKDIDQREGANCLITDFKSGNEAYAVTDLTDAYGPSGANSVIRGLKMIKDKECVIIQDEIALTKPGEIYWFAHTIGTIDVADDGRSAIVTVGSDRLWVGLMSAGGEFSVMEAKPLSTSLQVSGATVNSKYRKLAIHLTNTKEATISVACIPLKNNERRPAWTPSVQSISEWAGKTEANHNPQDREQKVLQTPKVTVANASTGVMASWSTVTGATGYLVYRKADGESKWTKIATIASGTTVKYTDEKAVSGTTYYYTVKATADSGSVTSSYKSSAAILYLKRPTLQLTNTSVGVKIGWDEIAGATGYYVYRKIDSGSWSRIATISNGSTVSYTDTTAISGTTYYYSVKANNGSAVSTYQTTKTIMYLKRPTVTLSNVSNGVKIGWDEIIGATGYYVYRKNGSGSWSRIATISKGTDVSYTDTTAASGITYYYTVKACNGSNVSTYVTNKYIKRK